MAHTDEIRIAVGSPTGKRSTVWKFWVRNEDVYIQTRMFGRDAKVSLHASGDCQWSATSDWVKRVPGRKNADRHFQKWKFERPDGTEALQVFQIRIPETELRQVSTTESLEPVQWIPTPPVGHTVSLDCYITPKLDYFPEMNFASHLQHLFSIRLSDTRLFTVLLSTPALDGRDLEPLRTQMNEQARRAGLAVKPQYRGSAFTVGDTGVRGLIEMCALREGSHSIPEKN